MTRSVVCTLALAIAMAMMTICATAFSPLAAAPAQSRSMASGSKSSRVVLFHATSKVSDDSAAEIIGRRITVKGDVQGGYYRACVLNEGGKFRRLLGMMTDPDSSSDTAEIYVEGKRKMVEGFIRWCKKGDVGLSQRVTVVDVVEEEPTGLYDDFYVKTK